MTDHIDGLVDDYLARVSMATAGLPADRRDELLRDLREHIATGRAELEPETEERVREILERLGDPWVIARAAAEDVVPPPAPAPAPAATPVAPAPRQRPMWIIAGVGVFLALLLLCGGFFMFALRNDGAPEPAEPVAPAPVTVEPAATTPPEPADPTVTAS